MFGTMSTSSLLSTDMAESHSISGRAAYLVFISTFQLLSAYLQKITILLINGDLTEDFG